MMYGGNESYYCSAAVCRRGHVATGNIERTQIEAHCSKCGANILTACLSCEARLQVYHIVPGVISGAPYEPPDFCEPLRLSPSLGDSTSAAVGAREPARGRGELRRRPTHYSRADRRAAESRLGRRRTSRTLDTSPQGRVSRAGSRDLRVCDDGRDQGSHERLGQ